ncbi:MAG TPA: hypothetical protein VLA92_00755 [Candidatus Saccharimonadales bacterium]|nr:hypothetical protein [Candidatus Saccharimonadales bacterium]
MTTVTTYDQLQLSVDRIMDGYVPAATPMTVEMQDGSIEVAAKLFMGEGRDYGWPMVYGIARNPQTGESTFEEHSCSPTSIAKAHVCSPMGCSCYHALDGNILYGGPNNARAQGPDPGVLASVIGRTVTARMYARYGIDVFGESVIPERQAEIVKGMRGPRGEVHQLFRSAALARAFDIELGFIPQ